jgi:hypothetical protein
LRAGDEGMTTHFPSCLMDMSCGMPFKPSGGASPSHTGALPVPTWKTNHILSVPSPPELSGTTILRPLT